MAGVHLYSGRPDPTWEVKASVAERLSRYWRSLEPRQGGFPSAAPLGYRGCFLQRPGREWLAYGDAIMLKKDGASEVRLDKERRFEKVLLASAPAGLLPPSLSPTI